MAKHERDPNKHERETPEHIILSDRRAMEKSLWDMMAQVQGKAAADTPLARAQDVMDRAFQETNPARRAQLAKQALEICPDCADAYVVLAELARTRKETRELYAKAVAAGERALGEAAFTEHVGRFWGMLETRPYMRAREGLAHALWNAGQRDEAVRHLQEMLRLNPNDNQGVRYALADFLLYLERDDDLETLLRQFADDAMATWSYTKALVAFRRHGDTAEAQQALAAAKKANRHVPDYLLGRKAPPERQPPHYSLGDESEAIVCVRGLLAPWRYAAGALDWLRAHDEQIKKRLAQAPQPKGPLSAVKNWLKQRLPREDDVWQADARRQPRTVIIAGDHIRFWLGLVTCPSNGLVLAHQIFEERPSAALVWDTLVQAMQYPAAGQPHRPAAIQAGPGECWETLRPHLAEIGVALTTSDQLEHWTTVFKGMGEHLGGLVLPGLLEMPGSTPAQVAGFYEAAASFFQNAPWKPVGDESSFKIECGKFQSGPWYGVIMGQSGMTLGLALYDNLQHLKGLWSSAPEDRRGIHEATSLSVTFDEEVDVPAADVEAAQQHGWPVARSDAWPLAFRKERGLSLRPPLMWELELLEGCLRAVPEFIGRRAKDDATREEIVVPAASGDLRLALSWVVDVE